MIGVLMLPRARKTRPEVTGPPCAAHIPTALGGDFARSHRSAGRETLVRSRLWVIRSCGMAAFVFKCC